METFNLIAGICSILSLIISLLIANKVWNINTKINVNAKSPKQSASFSNRVTQVGGDQDNTSPSN